MSPKCLVLTQTSLLCFRSTFPYSLWGISIQIFQRFLKFLNVLYPTKLATLSEVPIPMNGRFSFRSESGSHNGCLPFPPFSYSNYHQIQLIISFPCLKSIDVSLVLSGYILNSFEWPSIPAPSSSCSMEIFCCFLHSLTSLYLCMEYDLLAPKLTNILPVLQGSSFKHCFLQKWNEFFLFYGPTEPYIEPFRALCTLYSLSPFLDRELLQRKDYFPILQQLGPVQGLAQSSLLNKFLNLLNHLLLSCHFKRF